jgi:hypothetical protein
VLERAADGADVVVVNPRFLLGPGDVHRVSTWPVSAYLACALRPRAGSRSSTRATSPTA